MTGRLRLLLVVTAGLLASACAMPRDTTADLVIRDVAVHDGRGEEPFIASVSVDDGRIRTIGPAQRGKRLIDGRGLHLLPALIDMHVHLGAVRGADVPDEAYLDYGIATVRDLGGFVDQLSPRIGKGPLRVHSSLGTLNGEAMAPFHRAVRSPSEAKVAVTLLADSGASVIKIHRAFPPVVLPKLIEAAHARGLTVVGHVPLTLHPLDACRTGMDGIEHVGSLIEAYVSVTPGAKQDDAIRYLLSAKADPLFECLAGRQVAVTPTLVLYTSIARARAGRGPLPVEFAKAIAAMQAIVMRLHRAGVPLVAGSDSSGLDRPRVVPGESLIEELQLLREAGIPARAVERIAAANAARVLGLSTDGRLIAPGMPADLLLVVDDPARDWSVISKPRIILIGGVEWHGRSAADGNPTAR